MSCTRPLHIKNNRRRFNKSYDAPILTVPCGQCDSCMQSNQDQWVLRLNKEYQVNNDNGGTTLFLLFTYDEDHKPMFDDGMHRFPVFNKKHIDTFLDSFRAFLERRYGAVGLRYFIACEYGTKKNGTHRPHYHTALFLPRPTIAAYSLADVVTKIKRLWNKGYVLYGRNPRNYSNAVVRFENAMIYISKYCCKDMNFYTRPDVASFCAAKENKKMLKDEISRPRHWQSLGFGEAIADELRALPKEELYYILRNGMFTSVNNIFRKFPIPRYITEKLFKDRKVDPTLVIPGKDGQPDKFAIKSIPNDFYLQYCEDTFETQLRIKSNQYRTLCTQLGFDGIIDEVYCREHFKCSRRELREDMMKHTNYFTFDELAAYSLAYRNRPIHKSSEADYYGLIRDAKMQFLSCQTSAKYDWKGEYIVTNLESIPTYDKHSYFEHHEAFLKTLENIQRVAKAHKKKLSKERNFLKQQLKNKFIYEE